MVAKPVSITTTAIVVIVATACSSGATHGTPSAALAQRAATATASTTTAPTPVPANASGIPSHCPANLADSLASTGRAGQLVTVSAPGYATSAATVEAFTKIGGCWIRTAGPWHALIGQNGFSDNHREGDGTTPTGLYSIAPVVYGNSPNPGTKETYHRLVCGDWWDEDPTSPDYNTFQHVPCGETPPFGGGSEALWTEKAPYPSFAVIDYNTDPVVPYAGSAIFLAADTGVPTTGCVSIPLPDLDRVLRWIEPGRAPVVAMGPASEMAGL